MDQVIVYINKTALANQGCEGLGFYTIAIKQLQTSFKAAGCFEAHGFRSGDFHRLSGLRITTHTGGTLLHGEGSESDKLYFLGLLDSSSDSFEDVVYGIFSGPFGRFFAHCFLHCFNKFGFVHGGNLFDEKTPILAR